MLWGHCPANLMNYLKASRPFDEDRDGFVIAAGGGMVVLEELNHALNRNSKIYGEIVGYSLLQMG